MTDGILIGDKYKIDADNLNITVWEKKIAERGKNTGKPYWTARGYYPNLRAALHGLVGMEVEESHLKDVKTVIKRLDAIEAHIDHALNKLLTQQIKAKKED